MTTQSRFSQLFIRILVTNIVNVILLGAALFLLSNIDRLAGEVAETRSLVLASQQSSEAAVLTADLERNSQKINELNSAFLDDSGLVIFEAALSELRASAVVESYSYISTQPTPDTTKSRGLPILVKATGDITTINNAVQKIFQLPAIIRPVTVKLTKEESSYKLEYGIFVYVK